MASLQTLSGLNFVDVCNHANYTLCNHFYFAALVFLDSSLSAKIGPLEIFLHMVVMLLGHYMILDVVGTVYMQSIPKLEAKHTDQHNIKILIWYVTTSISIMYIYQHW